MFALHAYFAMTSVASNSTDSLVSLMQCLRDTYIYGSGGVGVTDELLDQVVLADQEYQQAAEHGAAFVAMYYVYAFAILIGNGFVIWLVYRKKELQTVTNLYITSLCLTGMSGLQSCLLLEQLIIIIVRF